MVYSFKKIAGLIFMVGMTACATNGQKFISQREPAPVVAATQIPKPEPEPAVEEKPKELFVRQKDLKIRRKAPINETGSLTDLNDPRAYLFGFERPVDVGSFVDVKVASNRVEQKTDKKDAAPTDEKAAQNPDDVSSIVKSLPNLEPGDNNPAELMKNIKMEVVERFENGDVLLMHRRRSMREGQASEIIVTARLPAQALSRSDQVATTDLADVDWRESSAGDIMERKSSNWEDEYSLRLSGFDESMSKQAVALDEKRQQLKAARDKLEKEMKTFIGEREKMTKERTTLLDTKAKNEEKILELESQNADLQKQVEGADSKSDDPADAGKQTKPADAKQDAKGAKKPDAKAADKKTEPKADAKKPAAAKADTKKK